jgi:formate hydrogenlyase subunit 6/NADH:ubiquinone oxidoreductase subunit I
VYPRVKEVVYDNRIEFMESFFTENYVLEIDREKCIGCGFCIRACPDSVFSSPDITGMVRVKTDDLKPEVPDITKCSFCGTCVYICPLTAIKLKKDGKTINLDKMGIVTHHVVPKLKYETVQSKKTQDKIKKHFIGEINVDWDKCVSCMSCVDVCPVNAFMRNKNKSKEDPKSKKVQFTEEKCIGCGTCARACNAEAITYNLSGLNFSGEFKAIFWNSLIERIRTQ